jgi:hypothetical protein
MKVLPSGCVMVEVIGFIGLAERNVVKKALNITISSLCFILSYQKVLIFVHELQI